MAKKQSARPVRLVADPKALDALASPARQELLSALGHGPATVRQLAARLGRTRQSLYFHLGVLEKARLARVTGEEGTGRDRERVYAFVGKRLAVGARAESARDLAAADRAVGAMLRITAREMHAALSTGVVRRTGARRELLALRAKVRLSPEDLGRLNARIDEVQELLARAKSAPPGGRLYSVLLVMTPSRESAAVPPRVKR